MKTCTKCKKEQSLDNFYKKVGVYHSMCKPCKKKHNKKVYDEQRAKLIQSQW